MLMKNLTSNLNSYLHQKNLFIYKKDKQYYLIRLKKDYSFYSNDYLSNDDKKYIQEKILSSPLKRSNVKNFEQFFKKNIDGYKLLSHFFEQQYKKNSEEFIDYAINSSFSLNFLYLITSQKLQEKDYIKVLGSIKKIYGIEYDYDFFKDFLQDKFKENVFFQIFDPNISTELKFLLNDFNLSNEFINHYKISQENIDFEKYLEKNQKINHSIIFKIDFTELFSFYQFKNQMNSKESLEDSLESFFYSINENNNHKLLLNFELEKTSYQCFSLRITSNELNEKILKYVGINFLKDLKEFIQNHNSHDKHYIKKLIDKSIILYENANILSELSIHDTKPKRPKI